jgi:predicted nucleic acid-binding protein
MTWMFDTDIMIHLINRKPGYERIARRMSGRSPGELLLSAVMLIASHARHVGASVVTNNEREFRRVPGLSVENWLKP